MVQRWKKNKTYYKEGKLKEYYQTETSFFESCRKTALQIAAIIQEKLKTDYDEEIEDDFLARFSANIFWIGTKCGERHTDKGFYYVDRKFYKDMYRYEEKENGD